MAQPTSRAPRVVAELGRPETPEETAARKAESSRLHRTNQTLFNLAVATLASLAIVLFLVLVVVRPDGAARQAVDYQAVASQSQPTVTGTLAVPVLPKGWSANSATIDTGTDGITDWTIGFLTPSGQYIGFVQGLGSVKAGASTSWVADQLQQAHSTGKTSISGTEWTVYNQRSAGDPGNYAYSLSTSAGDDAFVLHGTATTKEFETLAKAVVSSERRTNG